MPENTRRQARAFQNDASFAREAWTAIVLWRRRLSNDLGDQIARSQVAIETSRQLLRDVEQRFPEIEWPGQDGANSN